MPGPAAEGYIFFGWLIGRQAPEPEQFRFELLARGLLVGRELLATAAAREIVSIDRGVAKNRA